MRRCWSTDHLLFQRWNRITADSDLRKPWRGATGHRTGPVPRLVTMMMSCKKCEAGRDLFEPGVLGNVMWAPGRKWRGTTGLSTLSVKFRMSFAMPTISYWP